MSNVDNDDLDNFEEPETPAGEAGGTGAPASGGSNRNFLLAIGILGGVFILLVIALLLALFVLKPRLASQTAQQNVAIQTQNASTIVAATQAEQTLVINAQLLTPTITQTPVVTNTLPPTNTPVVAKPTFTSSPTVVITATLGDARTATVAALLTQAAGGQGGATSTSVGGTGATSTALPTTGIADEIGLPGLFGVALALIVVIVLVRRLRVSTSG